MGISGAKIGTFMTSHLPDLNQEKQHPLDTEELPVVQITLALHAPPSLAATLALLLREKFVTRDDIEHKYKTAANAKVAIHRIKEIFEKHELPWAIQVMRNVGYWLSADDKAALIQRIKELSP